MYLWAVGAGGSVSACFSLGFHSLCDQRSIRMTKRGGGK